MIGLLSLSSCVEVQGAAAEFSWSLRSFSGEPILSCLDAKIERIQLGWTTVAGSSSESPDGTCVDVDQVDGCAQFECLAGRGVTDFVIPPGSQLLWITPICDDGSPPQPGTFKVPPPLRREVDSGDVITMNSLLVVTDDHTDDTRGCDTAICTCDPQPQSVLTDRGEGRVGGADDHPRRSDTPASAPVRWRAEQPAN
ncbi:MAG: hypothetical protein AAGC55_05100 [Myxococcota bacterium]